MPAQRGSSGEPALLAGHAGGGQRTRAPRRLDYHHPQGDPGNDAIAPGKQASLGHGAEGHLGDNHALFGDLLVQRLVFRWIDHIDATGDNGDGAAGQAALVSAGVDSPG